MSPKTACVFKCVFFNLIGCSLLVVYLLHYNFVHLLNYNFVHQLMNTGHLNTKSPTGGHVYVAEQGRKDARKVYEITSAQNQTEFLRLLPTKGALDRQQPTAGSKDRDNYDVKNSIGSTVVSARSTTSLSCTQAHIDRRSVVLTTTNAGFLDVTENMLESIKRTRTCPNITVIAEDEPSYQRLTGRMLSQPGLHVQRSDLGATLSESMRVNSPRYNRFVNRRPRYILALLQQGYDVLFVDSDTFWFKDPFKDFQDTFDIAMLKEHKEPGFAFCDGFAYYRLTENTLRLVKLWVSRLKKTITPDQIILNQLISNKLVPGLAIKSLNPSNYPDGKRYFQTPGWREKNNDTVVLHLSFILGHDSKVDKLKKNGWWLV